jgi:hypothetical protein
MSTRLIVGWCLAGVGLVLLACAAWIGIRALIAKGDLQASVSLVSQIKTEIGAGNVKAAQATTKQLGDKVHNARDLTSDPIYRAAEILPLAGPNLTALRHATAIVSDVADTAVAPLASVAGSINLASFKPVNGAVQLKPLETVAPTVIKANAAMQSELADARAIDTTRTITPVNNAIKQLTDSLVSASDITDAAVRVVRLLPPMMGENGPRNYLLLFQNNAEARSTGGIPGALAVLHVENGAVSLTQQASSADFRRLAEPVMPLPQDTSAFYSPLVGEYIQDVNLTPQFPVAAQLAKQMWKQQIGTDVDGVITLDPVALSYLLKATGPVTLTTGDRLTSKNAVRMLLSNAYARFERPRDQDAFFASAAAEVFAKLAAGDLQPRPMISALVKAANEHRILIWSATADEQKSLEQTTLAGGLPVSSDTAQRFGVYLNDRTMAKMDYYLRTTVGLGQAVCRADKRPTYAVNVTLKSTAPADAASTLPAYVLGGTGAGVPLGSISTAVSVYAPRGATLVGAVSDGKQYAVNWGKVGGHPVGQVSIVLAPGQATTVQLQFLGASAFDGDLSAQTTPGVYVTETRRLDFNCESALK